MEEVVPDGNLCVQYVVTVTGRFCCVVLQWQESEDGAPGCRSVHLKLSTKLRRNPEKMAPFDNAKLEDAEINTGYRSSANSGPLSISETKPPLSADSAQPSPVAEKPASTEARQSSSTATLGIVTTLADNPPSVTAEPLPPPPPPPPPPTADESASSLIPVTRPNTNRIVILQICVPEVGEPSNVPSDISPAANLDATEDEVTTLKNLASGWN
ncbi:WAS/WASL-interacting protein family member 3-like [Schistocerca americana]|uniref:WAS/WASL-interacting protein family member 3-like n=1 Tax=Schistocerca americana TaxID=7009 RepID=UPI001F4FFDD2|nr:WAS/WASL-interacting protein family member 3-like [Schistocerca americana]